jgi:hypothetical protein
LTLNKCSPCRGRLGYSGAVGGNVGAKVERVGGRVVSDAAGWDTERDA